MQPPEETEAFRAYRQTPAYIAALRAAGGEGMVIPSPIATTSASKPRRPRGRTRAVTILSCPKHLRGLPDVRVVLYFNPAEYEELQRLAKEATDRGGGGKGTVADWIKRRIAPAVQARIEREREEQRKKDEKEKREQRNLPKTT